MFYELNDELIVFWNLGQTSENKSQINREKNGRNELSPVTFKIWFVQKDWDISGTITEMSKERIDEKTTEVDKSFRIWKKFLGTSKCSGKRLSFLRYIRYLIISRKQHEISKMNWYENAKVHGLSMDRLIRNVLPLDSGTIENVFVHS